MVSFFLSSKIREVKLKDNCSFAGISLSQMPQFFIKNEQISGTRAHITGEEARHILKVLRLGQNDPVTLFTADGTRYDCVIRSLNKHELYAEIITHHSCISCSECEIILAQAVLKSKKMDTVIQKSVELGVSRIVPYISERTVPRWDKKTCEKKVSHWQNIVTASIKQSGIRKLPIVDPVIPFNELIRMFFNMNRIILYENEKKNSLKKILQKIRFPAKLLVATGPEGGFSEKEIALSKENGYQPAGLGNLILRSETVPITVLSILRYQAGELETTEP